MEFKGTEGNWKNQDGVVLSSESIKVIADCYVLDEEDGYKALLVSKAPEMLELLQYFVSENMLSHEGDRLAINMIKQATEL